MLIGATRDFMAVSFVNFCVIPLRPYTLRLRERVFHCIRSAGLDILDQALVPSGTSDEEIVALLRQHSVAPLLIPFNAHRTDGGDVLTGAEMVERIDKDLPAWRQVPILMPISMFGASAAILRLAQMPDASRHRVLAFFEEDLNDPELPTRIRLHIQKDWRS